MGCVLNGPGESKAANIGISLPGTGEAPNCPVFIDGEHFTTLRGNYDELAVAFGAHLASDGWTVVREREEVDAILDIPPELDYEGYPGTLGQKERHEGRREGRRAEAAGVVRLERATAPIEDLDG